MMQGEVDRPHISEASKSREKVNTMTDTNVIDVTTGEVLTAEVVQQNNTPDLYDMIDRLGGKAGILSTLPNETMDDRIKLAAAVSNSTGLGDELGATINVVGFVIQAVEMEDDRTKQMQTVPRVVLQDDKGKTHHAISAPLFRDVRNMAGIVGDPRTWEKPVPIKVVKEGKGSSAYYTLKYVL